MSVPNVKLNNGYYIPIVGLGTWRSPSNVVAQAIKDAIDVGYRHFDCAHIYQNEREIGEALTAKINEGVVKREDLFVTSKLWNTYHEPSLVRSACETTLSNLCLDYLDCYLIHWPIAFKEGNKVYPLDERNRIIFSSVDFIDTWQSMEKLVDLGLCRTIGICNFNQEQIERLLKAVRIPPAILQIECHPYIKQRELLEYAGEKKIIVTAYSPLGSAHTPYEKPGDVILLKHPKILEIAKVHGKSVAQILLRYQTQHGNVVIPRSVTKAHMAANLSIFDFKLSDKDMCTLNSLDCNGRIIIFDRTIEHPEYPFKDVLLRDSISRKITMVVPNVVLNNGRNMPILGLGTWRSPPGVVAQAVKYAIDIGYRHIDTAYADQNEHEVGEGINAKISEGVVKREDIFITSKLWNTFHHSAQVRSACEKTLENLNTPYVDMFLIHWPMGYKESSELFPTEEEGKITYSDVDYVDTWKEMEKLVDDGLCKSIGISNFNSKQIERILKIARIQPATNQVECHPYLNQKKLMEFCKSKNIVLTAHCPLGLPNHPSITADDPALMENPGIIAIAEKYNKTPGQILIRYQLQRGNVVIPKSAAKSRIASNFDVFDFELSSQDMVTIDSLDCNKRFVQINNDCGVHPHYPFGDEL